MTVIHRPSPNDRVSYLYQSFLRDGSVAFDDFPDLIQQRLDAAFGRRNEKLAVVLSHILAQKSKPSAMFVILVFSPESSRPRTARNFLIAGKTLRSCTSFEALVTTKSSA
ncbi:hypothetical protein AS026_15580 [Rhizobium altiplani]|uniref:Uncharacterized protein n=1 Tax=Rhizobium altiplani TaxID=1864509 RepID=A0A109JB71_9HYPH|nr:hypothetical protein AS026_15580 [Rhizobium altiplani]